MKIFTFWEPKNKIPEYLKLCMKTWQKFIPNAEIILLDFENLFNYIDVDEFNKILMNGYFSLPQIADYIRVILLEKYGGIWMDVDTIILRDDVTKYINDNYSATFFGNPNNLTTHICWINAKKNSKLLKYWTKKANEKINDFNVEKIDNSFWSYLGNSIVDPYIQLYPEEVKIIDVVNENCMPERKQGENTPNNYVDYYFVKKYHLSDIKSSMILLHNSWTPAIFKDMSQKEFILYDCTLSNILQEVLEINSKSFVLSVEEFNLINELLSTLSEAAKYMYDSNNNIFTTDCIQILAKIVELLSKRTFCINDFTILLDLKDAIKLLSVDVVDYQNFYNASCLIKEKFNKSLVYDK